MIELNHDVVHSILAENNVQDLLHALGNSVSVRSREKSPGFIMELVTWRASSTEQEALARALLSEIIHQARKREIALNREHFDFINSANTGATDSNPVGNPSKAYSQDSAARWQKYERPADTQPTNDIPGPIISTIPHSLEDGHGSIVAIFQREVGDAYHIEYGTIENKPVIKITPTIITEMLVGLGLEKPPEKNIGLAKALVSTFKKSLNRLPNQGEIIIGDREVDVSAMFDAAQDNSSYMDRVRSKRSACRDNSKGGRQA